MKRPTTLLIPVLVIALALVYFGDRAPQPAGSAERVPIRRPAPVGTKAKVNPESEILRFSVREVDSADYRQYVANLRRINVPEVTVVDIIVADVNRLFAERATKLKADNKRNVESNFWQVISVGSPNRMMAGMRYGAGLPTLDRERIRLINDLLGKEISDPLVLQQPEAFKIDHSAMVFSHDFLPEPKQLALNAFLETARAEFRARVPHEATDEQSMQLRQALSKKLDTELATILSPAEKLEYDARYSILAQHLRATLAGMQPTREEFLQIVAAKRYYFDEYENPFFKTDPIKISGMFKARREVDTRLKQALGTERCQQLQRGLDVEYRRDTELVLELGLNQEIANELYRLREDLRTAAALGTLSFLSGQNLAAAQASALNLLGEAGYQRYTSRPEGRWLASQPNFNALTISLNPQTFP